MVEWDDAAETGASPEDVVGLARALIALPSVNPGLDAAGDGEAGIAAMTAGWLQEWGFGVELIEARPGRPSVVARLERGPGRSLILSGHLDTVGVEGMSIPPFEATVRDGRIWGRGAADMKGGVAAALQAARDAASSSALRGTLIIALTADEEEAAVGCRRLLEDGLRADAAVVCEPTGLAIMPAHKGFVWLCIDFRGQAAHGSRPERGVDAIRHAGLFLARLDEVEASLSVRSPHPLLGFGSIHAGTIEGGTAPSVYPSSCRLVLERRTLPGERQATVRSEVEYLLGRLRSEVPSLDAEVTILLDQPGSEVRPDHPLVESLKEAVAAAGLEPRVAGMTAWVEASLFNVSGTPAISFGPGRIEDAHAADESVAISDLEGAHRVLTELIGRYLR
jgi:acetylornithine deacetylase